MFETPSVGFLCVSCVCTCRRVAAVSHSVVVARGSVLIIILTV